VLFIAIRGKTIAVEEFGILKHLNNIASLLDLRILSTMLL
jgi:hypothetical protein